MTSVGRTVSAAGAGCPDVPPSSSSSAAVKQCAGCGTDILDRYLLNAIDAYWHTGCLRCAVCHAALADIGATCFTRAGLILCKPDYIRMFGSTGTCAGCGQNIPPSEMVLRASTGGQSSAVYHLQCFSCAACHCRLVAGDKYRIVNGHIICGDHDLPPQPLSALAGKQQQQQHAAMAVHISPSPAAAAGRLAGPAVPTPSSGASHGARSRQKVC